MKKFIDFFKIVIMSAIIILIVMGYSDIDVNAQTGATGYQIIVPSNYDSALYVLIDSDNEYNEYRGIPDGLYELDGQVVYIFNCELAKVRIADGYYANQYGAIMPYTADTKAKIDAEIDELLNTKLIEAKQRYGIEFCFKPNYFNYQNYHFVEDVMKQFEEHFPEGSIPVIAKASATRTKRALTFQQLLDDNNEMYVLTGAVSSGNYYYQTNRINAIPDYFVLAHEMGHSFEKTLNDMTNGQLKQTFESINAPYGYSKYYFYYGNEEISDSFYGGMSQCVRRDYAAISFSEDFAETFSDALLISTEELTEMVGRGSIGMPYFQKVLYIKQLFNQYAGSTILQ